jgi:predicted kinase
MKLNIKILVGIPACGKSTWAKTYILDNPNTKRINRDDLRNMLDAGKFTDGNENFLRVLRLEMVRMCISMDKHVILDDTNCYASKLEETILSIKTMAGQLNKEIEIEIVDFDASVDECVRRNFERENSVKESAIYHMQSAKIEINYDSLHIDKYTKIT